MSSFQYIGIVKVKVKFKLEGVFLKGRIVKFSYILMNHLSFFVVII